MRTLVSITRLRWSRQYNQLVRSILFKKRTGMMSLCAIPYPQRHDCLIARRGMPLRQIRWESGPAGFPSVASTGAFRIAALKAVTDRHTKCKDTVQGYQGLNRRERVREGFSNRFTL
jgi:hypothetical protein